MFKLKKRSLRRKDSNMLLLLLSPSTLLISIVLLIVSSSSSANLQQQAPSETLAVKQAPIPKLPPVDLILHVQPKTSYEHNNVTYTLNDINKEVTDYGDDFMDSLHFVQTEREAGNQEQAARVIESMIAKHHSNEELYQYLSELAQKYPNVTHLYSIGKSAEGRDLWVLEITEQPQRHILLKPEFKFVANMHGNEVVGRELLLHLARLLLENYREASLEPANDTRPSGPKFVRKLLKTTRIHLLPSMNPDGYAKSKEGCVYETPSKRGRINTNNIDLNRNFPDRVLGNQLDAGTQPEARAIMGWSQLVPFVLSANIHGGSLVASYGYDGNNNGSSVPEYTATPDDDVMIELAKTYATSHPLMESDEICYDECTNYHNETFPTGITNGAAWYPLYGGMQDWLYENTNSIDVTLEVGCNQYPAASLLPQYWQYNKRALLNYIKKVHLGIKGIVRDDSNKQPIANVTVHVYGRNHNISTTEYGDYFRLLLPGFHIIQFEKSGYLTERMTITVTTLKAAIYNIYLRRDPNSALPGPTSIESTTTTSSSSAIDSSGLLPLEPVSPSESQSTTTGGEHSLVVAILVMTIVITLILVAMAGAYVIQKRRFTRSQSVVSMELQPAQHRATHTASTGISLPGGQQQQQKGSSISPTHLSA